MNLEEQVEFSKRHNHKLKSIMVSTLLFFILCVVSGGVIFAYNINVKRSELQQSQAVRAQLDAFYAQVAADQTAQPKTEQPDAN